MIRGVTSDGFEYEIDAKTLDNMELVDAISDATEGDKLAISRICRHLLGVDQRKALYNHHRKEDGTVPIEAVSKTVIEIFSTADDGKK